MLRRYLDAGIAFTQMTRARAEAIVKDLVKTGEVQRDQAQKNVDDLVDRSRKNTEQLLEIIRTEIRNQFQSLGLATQDDVRRIEKRLDAVETGRPAAAAASAGPTKKAPAKKAVAKKAPAKKAPAKKASGATEKS